MGRLGEPRRGRQHEVRAYILDNALMWLRDYHVDGLRLDAVHALQDCSDGAHPGGAGRRGRRPVGDVGRPLSLIAESDLNDPTLIRPREARRLRARRTVERRLPPRGPRRPDRRDRGLLRGLRGARRAAEGVEKGFFHDGTFSSFRGRDHGVPIEPRTCRPGGWWSCSAGPRPDRQPRRRRPARRRASTTTSWPARRCSPSPPPSRRCSSWARSGAPRRRCSSSPPTPSPNSARPRRRDGSRSS